MEKKITKKEQIKFLKEKLAIDKRWALKALIKIFDLQTVDEQEQEITNIYNKVGFTGVDGKILSSFAKQYIKFKKLSDKQMAILLRKMPKYWKQILEISNMEKINQLIQNERNTNRR